MQDLSSSRIVLIVEDSEPTARAIAKVLTGAGLQVSAHLRGNDAVAYAMSHRVDAAVVDIHLPDISGLVVSQKLRERLGPATPILILSGDTSMEMLNALPHVGATYFFSKPVNATELVHRLQEWLSPPSPDAPVEGIGASA